MATLQDRVDDRAVPAVFACIRFVRPEGPESSFGILPHRLIPQPIPPVGPSFLFLLIMVVRIVRDVPRNGRFPRNPAFDISLPLPLTLQVQTARKLPRRCEGSELSEPGCEVSGFKPVAPAHPAFVFVYIVGRGRDVFGQSGFTGYFSVHIGTPFFLTFEAKPAGELSCQRKAATG